MEHRMIDSAFLTTTYHQYLDYNITKVFSRLKVTIFYIYFRKNKTCKYN